MWGGSHLEEGCHPIDNVVKPRLVPSAVRLSREANRGAVELVDHDDESSHTQGLCELRVLAGLTAAFESSLKLSLSRRDEQNRDIRLAGPLTIHTYRC